jgi:hypothetical protein
VTRASNGLAGSTSHFASPSRFFGASGAMGFSAAGTPGSSLSPSGLSYAPRASSFVSRGIASSITMTFVRLASNSFSALRAASSDAFSGRRVDDTLLRKYSRTRFR